MWSLKQRASRGRRLVFNLAAVTALTVLITGGAAAPALAISAPKVTFAINYNDCRLYGYAPKNTTIKLQWTTRIGDLVGRATVKSDTHGSWQTPCLNGVVERGDRLNAAIGTWHRTFSVPRLTLHADRITNVVSGKAPPSHQVALEVVTYDGFDFGNSSDDVVFTGSDGSYTDDFTSHLDFGGDGSVSVNWQDTGGDIVSLSNSLPHVSVIRGDSSVEADASRGSVVQINLLNGSLNPKGSMTGSGDRYGTTYGDFVNADGDLAVVAAGDTIQAPAIGSDASFVVPPASVTVIAATDVMSGVCTANAPYAVSVQSQDYSQYHFWTGHAKANGTFSRDVTADFDVRVGDYVDLTCFMPAGDTVDRYGRAS